MILSKHSAEKNRSFLWHLVWGGLSVYFATHNQDGSWGGWEALGEGPGEWQILWGSGLFINWQESSLVLRSQPAWVQISALPLPSWVTLSKLLPLSMPQFPLL